MVWLIHPYNINEIHRGSLSAKVIVICLEAVKMYGNSPIKLFTIIKKNRATNTTDLPTEEEGPKRVLNSLLIFMIR